MYKKLFMFLNQMIIIIIKCVKCYYKEWQLILLQSATVITKCDRTTWKFLKFGISKHPARRDQRRGYWLPTWLSGVSYHFDRKGIHYQTAIEDRSSALTNQRNVAERRTRSMEQHLARDPHNLKMYGVIIIEQEKQNHCRYLPLYPTPCLV